MARCNTDTCCLTLPLLLEKWQEDRLAKRFEIARQIYNTLLRAELKKLRHIQQSTEYKEIQTQIQTLIQEADDHKTNHQKITEAFKKRNALLKKSGFTEYGFKGDMGKYYKHFNDNIGSSVAVHGIASQVWTAFEKMLYGNGKRVHFKREGDIHSLRGYSRSGASGGLEIIFRGDYIEWKGLRLRLKLSQNNAYKEEMLSKRVKYVRILRTKGKTKDRWYAQLTLEGIPAIKYNKISGREVHPVGKGVVGIDIGPQTIAYSSEKETALLELANRVQNIEYKKRLIQRKMDRSRRAMNPDNYAPNGTIKRGVKLTHNQSKHYQKLRKELAFLMYQQASIRKQQHIELANHLLSLGDTFFVEKMEWASLARRAKETAISEKTGKYKRKKRFGKSISNKAPAMLIGILNQKCKSRGLPGSTAKESSLPGVNEVPTIVRASQYNHLSNTYEKKSLSQRWNEMPDGNRIQRDLYSAFLLQHLTQDKKEFDVAALNRDYENFVTFHHQTIAQLLNSPKTITSMGIKRTHS